MYQNKYVKHLKLLTLLFLAISLLVTIIAITKGEKTSLVAALFFLVTMLLYFVYNDRRKALENEYFHNLSYQVKKVSNDAFLNLPIGIIVYNELNRVIWTNHYAERIYNKKLKNLSIDEFVLKNEYIKTKVKDDNLLLAIGDRFFDVQINSKTHVIYFFDITSYKSLEKKYNEESVCLGIISLDNYDETLEHMDEQTKSDVVSKMAALITNWATDNSIYIRRYTRSHYIAVFNERILDKLKKNSFHILDEVRETSEDLGLSLTISIGIGHSTKSITELGDLAKAGLDLALSRGGDQVAIKGLNGETLFFGGKAEAQEKRTRVRARVISQSIQNLIRESDKVIVMGHRTPDFDSIGASIGIYKLANSLDKDAFIIKDVQSIDAGVLRLMQELKESDLYDIMISPNEALGLITPNTLLFIVDNHKPNMTISKEVLDACKKRIVIDHHRRGDEFIEFPLVTYLESYASSTCELVTELMEYMPKSIDLSVLEATAMLGGIIVDTNHFTFRTGQRTFDAAAFLKSHGADTIMIQDFLKEELGTYLTQANLIKNTEIYRNMAIIKSNENVIHDSIFIAKIADQLLTFNNIKASFVISKLDNNLIGISARSLAEVNVQLVMEALGGGGHLTSAACQIEDSTIENVYNQLINAINTIYTEGDEEDESDLS